MTSSLLAASMLMVHFWTVLVRITRSTWISFLLLGTFAISSIGALLLARAELLTYEGFLAAIGRSATLTGRVDLWELGMRIHAERPLFGWGFDGLASIPPRFSIGFGQLHSGFIDLLVRGGDVGAFILLLILLRTTGRLLSVYRQSPIEGSWGLGLLIAIVLHNVTEASLARAPHPMWVVISMLILAGAGPAGVKASTQVANMRERRTTYFGNIVGVEASGDRRSI